MTALLNRPAVRYGVVLALVLVAPLLVYRVLLMQLMCYALLASALNLLVGYTGLLSFGHAAFFAGAAYLTGHTLKVVGWPPEVALLAGTATAAALGWAFGFLAIRRQGIYFSMITLALAQMLFFVFVQARFTGGEDGLQGIPRGRLLGVVSLEHERNLYLFVVAVCAAALWLVHRSINSPFGQILRAIRDNEPRAISLGYDVGRYKLLAFVLSAGIAGVAGALKTIVFRFVTLTDAHWHTSGDAILMTLLGGMGTALGPVVGAGIVVMLRNELADKVGSLVTLIIGAIFVICVLLFRRGIVGELDALWIRCRAARERRALATPLPSTRPNETAAATPSTAGEIGE